MISTPKASIAALVSLLCLGVINTQDESLCYQFDPYNNQCRVCYQGQVNIKTGKCEAVQQENNCRLWRAIADRGVGKIINVCSLCHKGYVLVAKPNDLSVTYCVKDPNFIENCFAEATILGHPRCTACEGGVPIEGGKACLAWSRVPNPISGCKVGAVVKGLSPAFNVCLICEGDLVFNDATQKCEQPPPGFEGCLEIDTRSCSACNVFNGYSILASGKCVKIR